MQRCKNTREFHRRIDHRAAVHPAVKIRLWSFHADLEVRQSPQRTEDRRLARREHRRIRNHNGITLQPGRVFGDERRQVLAADFLLTFREHDHVHRQRTAGFHMRFECLQVQKQLPLVVDTATREELTLTHGRFERGRRPQLQRFRRLHIVVAIDQHRRFTRCSEPLGENDRVAGRVDDLDCRQSDGRALRRDPLGGAANVGRMFAVCADTRNAEKVMQLVVDARLRADEELFEILGDGGHWTGFGGVRWRRVPQRVQRICRAGVSPAGPPLHESGQCACVRDGGGARVWRARARPAPRDARRIERAASSSSTRSSSRVPVA